MPGRLRVDEEQGVRAEAALELRAPVVRHGGHLDDSFTDAEARAHREISNRDVEVHEQTVAEEREWLSIGKQLSHVVPHDRNLRFQTALWIPAPTIARDAFLRRQVNALWRLARAIDAAADDERETSGVGGERGQSVKPRLKRRWRK